MCLELVNKRSLWSLLGWIYNRPRSLGRTNSECCWCCLWVISIKGGTTQCRYIKKKKMTGSSNLCACLISWVHVGKCLHNAACFKSRHAYPHAWMISLMWKVYNMLKDVIILTFKDHWRSHQSFLHFKLSKWLGTFLQVGCVTTSPGGGCFVLFNLSCNLQRPPLTGNAVYQLGMTPAEVIYAGLYFPR